MLEKLRSLILDMQEAPLFPGVARRLTFDSLPGKASVCIGVRRSGKSTWMGQIMEGLARGGVPRENILHLNFFDDRLRPLSLETLGLVPEAYYSLYPAKRHREVVHCFFDEIQSVPGWESFIDRLMRTERCQIHLTGSSAEMLASEVATQMRGRALVSEMFPFSFREYLDFLGRQVPTRWTAGGRAEARNALEGYWASGGFPEVLGADQRTRVRIHQDYFQSILFRDLIERHDISHPRAVADAARRLVDNAGSAYTVNSLVGYLQALGHKVPKASVGDYVRWFEDAYFLFTVRLFDASLARSNTNPKKVYCVDHALVTSVASGILVNSGHLLENLVFVALRRLWRDIFYYRDRNGYEVDFVVSRGAGERRLVQVCESLADPRTAARETRALEAAMGELGIREATLVTREEARTIRCPAGQIEVIPIWRFLLELPDASP